MSSLASTMQSAYFFRVNLDLQRSFGETILYSVDFKELCYKPIVFSADEQQKNLVPPDKKIPIFSLDKGYKELVLFVSDRIRLYVCAYIENLDFCEILHIEDSPDGDMNNEYTYDGKENNNDHNYEIYYAMFYAELHRSRWPRYRKRYYSFDVTHDIICSANYTFPGEDLIPKNVVERVEEENLKCFVIALDKYGNCKFFRSLCFDDGEIDDTSSESE